MARDITYDRLIGPTTTSAGLDATTTTLTVTAETAPTTVTASTYGNFVAIVQNPGDTTPSSVATCTDTQGSSYTLIKEVRFAGYALDVFAHTATTVNVDTTVTVSHQPSKRRIVLCDEWYNVGTLEHSVSAFASTASASVDTTDFRVGNKHWLVYAVLALGGSAHGDYVNIPDDWNLLHDTGTNVGDGADVRIVTCYQIASKRKKVNFEPKIPNARVWAAVMFAYKQKT